MLSFFPRGVLDEILNLIESVSEGFPSYFFIILKPCRQVMHQEQFETKTIGAKVSEKHSFSKLFSIVDRQWLLKDIQPTLDALI